jgi:hypothetical protein
VKFDNSAVEVSVESISDATSSPETFLPSPIPVSDTSVSPKASSSVPESLPVFSSDTQFVPDTDSDTKTVVPESSVAPAPDDILSPSAFLWKKLFTNVFAQENAVTSSTEPVIVNADTQSSSTQNLPIRQDDSQAVPICEIKGKPCHTLELSGFGVGAGVSLGDIKNVQLRLSLASRGVETADVNDQMFVKYIYK